MSKTRIIVVFTILAVMLAAVPVFTSCGKVAEYADPITENILIAMNNQDYTSFSKDFDQSLKNELPESSFPDLVAAVNGSVGNYITGSKKITGFQSEGGLTTATYEADFEGMEDVTVEITFKKINNQSKVVGLWFK